MSCRPDREIQNRPEFAATRESGYGPSRHFAAMRISVAFGAKRTWTGRQNGLDQSKMTRSEWRGAELQTTIMQTERRVETVVEQVHSSKSGAGGSEPPRSVLGYFGIGPSIAKLRKVAYLSPTLRMSF
jgi:hypothetical protein